MDLFEKCEGFFSDPEVAQAIGYATNPRTAQAWGLYPFFIALDQTEGTEVTILLPVREAGEVPAAEAGEVG